MRLVTRRQAILASLVMIGVFPLRSHAEGEDAAAPGEPYSDPSVADFWLKEWAAGKRAAHGMMHLTRFADPMYVLTQPIAWTPDPEEEADVVPVTVPAGFVTDFASIPRAFWSILRPDGDYCYAAVLHDYLYWEQAANRSQADNVLYLAMKDFHVAGATRATIYHAVRAGGGVAWRGNRKLKEAGEKRLLKKLPEDPTVRWGDWKQRPDVF